MRRKLADFLTEMSRQGLDEIDPASPCARALQNCDGEALLRRDIRRICNEVSLIEGGRILRLYAQLVNVSPEREERLKVKLKSIASKVVRRVEQESGALNLPSECRELLMNL